MLPNPLIEIGPFKIYMYGIMIAVGVLFAFFIMYLYGKKKNVSLKNLDFIYYLSIIAIAVGFGFAALFHGIYAYIERGVFDIGGGITFLGGLIGGVLTAAVGFFLFRKKRPTALAQTVELIPICIVIAHAFGRLGCFFAGCCYGIKTDSFLGVKFPGLEDKVYPTQLFEAVFLFLLFILLSFLYLKKNTRHNVSVYIISYGVFRFFIEFIRGDDRGEFIGNISPSQFWSLALILIGIALIFVSNKLKNLLWKENGEIASATLAEESDEIALPHTEPEEEEEKKPEESENKTENEEKQ